MADTDSRFIILSSKTPHGPSGKSLRLDAALSAFEEALALRRSRGGREAGDVGAQRALSVNLERLADLREDRGHRMRALDLYRESYDVAARLAAADPARFGPDLALTRQRLAELEAKIAT